ncbi:sugar phosphate isomerase/epimerase family protein [Deminuibacter soli]|uniref:Sugar phosphate isomerase/epimerase n=1 Tax=Deminuibacter soli TaxID=2291815 RepID=A0A3E1NRA0_9BACT|nr:sugar phosphate isomerase/epimerase family protein [Deminuibacter soli]RFM30344.1 sugar phosphate isomerase/epimerase [Deminuibacter soli]
MQTNRRQFLMQVTGAAAGVGLIKQASAQSATFAAAKDNFFKISLAEWSFHKLLFAKKMDNLDFPVVAKQQYGIDTVEYVNQFFKDKATDTAYLNDLLKRCKDNGVTNHLIMVDGEGPLADLDDTKRKQAVENHYKWVDAAKHLGCITIRVNTFGQGSDADVQKAAIDGLGRLGEYAAKQNINVIVENHGGITSNGEWLSSTIKQVNMKNVGILPDFGNFCVKREGGGPWGGKCLEEYDRYKGVSEMAPYAKGASAKTYDFDASGNCIETDYTRMMKILKDSGFKGYVGIEYEGEKLSEEEGIRKTKALLEKVVTEI